MKIQLVPTICSKNILTFSLLLKNSNIVHWFATRAKKSAFGLLALVSSNIAIGQLSDLHYLPPLKQASNAVVNQQFYLSTPETESFNVYVYRGTSATAVATLSISNTSPAQYNPGNGDNGITFIPNASTGMVLSNAGLRFESEGGQKFYVNFRGRSTHQAVSLTSKGRQAMGTAFKWGGMRNGGTNYSILNSTLGIMATEDGTVVDVFGYDTNCRFRLGNNGTGITDDVVQITLNAGESFVFEILMDGTETTKSGWLGASITSNNKIAVSNGQLHVSPAFGNQDAGIDQPIPENVLGREYVFIRGNGIEQTEFPIIIATQNNTEIFVNGANTPIATINNGDFFEIPGSNYSSNNPGANMFIRTSKEAYAYQCMAGSSGTETVGLNFIAPVNCLMPDIFDNIPSIQDVAGATFNGGVTIVASTQIPNSSIKITDNTGTVDASTLVERTVNGSSDWKTFYAPGLTGNVSVESTGPISIGFVGVSGAAGIAGYFSGFDTVPVVEVNIAGGGCLPGAILEVTEGFTSYTWYRDGVVVPDETSNTYAPPIAGDYYVVVTKGSCTYESAVASIFDCNPEIVVTNEADKTEVLEGDTVNFTIEISYFGFTPVSNLAVDVTIPEGLTLVGSTPSFGSYNNDVWTIGDILSGENHLLVLETRVDEVFTDTDLTLTAANRQTEAEGSSIPDDFTETIRITDNSISVTKTARAATDGSYGTLGEEIVYDMVVTNTGPNTLTDITIVDTNADVGSIAPANVASLAPGATASFTAKHTITNGDLTVGSVTNTAQGRASLPNGYVITDDSDNPLDNSDTDNNGDGEPDDPTVVIMNNRAPTDLSLLNNSITENSAIGTIIGKFSATDPDTGDTDTYTLVTGTGATDNTSFTIDASGNLLLAIVPDYETKSNYKIRVRITDSGDLIYEKSFSININDINEMPTNIVLNNLEIAENSSIGTVIGILGNSDQDIGNTYTYTLVVGNDTEDKDNGSFTIDGTDLKLAVVPDYETQSSYNIFLNVNDGENDYRKGFGVNITDRNERPTDIFLDNMAIAENSTVGTVVSNLSATDEDMGNTYTYSLATGNGTNDKDNASFSIVGTELKLEVIPDYETQSSFEIYLNVNDGENDFQKAFTITVTDANEAPTDIILDNTTISENSAVGTVVGSLGNTDEDMGNTYTYTFVAGNGINDIDNGSFSIAGTDLKLAASPDFETRSSYTVNINVNDGDNDYQKEFTITITDRNESPTDISLDNNSITENSTIGTIVGVLSAEDVDIDNMYNYSLATGNGINDMDNESFSINGSVLNLDVIPDFETKSSYSIYINVNDGENDFSKVFTIAVTDVDEDLDGDGVPNMFDNCPDTSPGDIVNENGCSENQRDLDGDGVFDAVDNCISVTNPNQEDLDGDYIGDVCDDDIDGDGIPNDTDAFPYSPTGDADNDGIPDSEDAFPNDADENIDTDGDGIGDNEDTDDDGDGYSDEVELEEGTDAKNVDEYPDDTDGDGIPDSMDDDDDNDGISDDQDAFPKEATPLLVPAQAFTPNGDGNNDTWVIPGINNYPNNTVKVFNRWGHEVYSASGYTSDWEGFYRQNREKLPAGSYMYILNLGNGTESLRGWLFINY